MSGSGSTIPLSRALAAGGHLALVALLRDQVEVDCAGERLPPGLLRAVREAGLARLAGLGEEARWAVQLLGLGPAAGIAGTLPPLPFSVVLAEDGEVSLVAERNAGQSPLLGEPVAHGWVRALAVETVSVDLRHIDHVNSVLVAWLLQLATAAKPARMRINHPSPQAATQLRQLRLDHLMEIVRGM